MVACSSEPIGFFHVRRGVALSARRLVVFSVGFYGFNHGEDVLVWRVAAELVAGGQDGELVVPYRVDGARHEDIRAVFALKGHGGACLEPAVNAEILHRLAIGSVQCRVALHRNLSEGLARQAAGNPVRKVRHAGDAIGDAAAKDGHQAFL